MKTYSFSALVLIMLLTACGGQETGIEAQKAELAKLRKTVSEAQTRIAELEAAIAQSEKIDPKSKLRRVEAVKLASTSFSHFVEVQGNVVSDQNVSVYPELNGTIVEWKVEPGESVSKGQVLAVLDGEVLRRNVEELEKRLELATTVYQRQENLWKQKIGSEIQYLQAKNAKESLEKSIASVKAQVNKTSIKAPISGVVDEIFQKQGEMANPMLPFARVVNLSTVKISADISESYIPNIRKGDQVIVSFPTIQKEVTVRVTTIGQVINTANRTFKVEMVLSNPQGHFKPNMVAVVKFKDYGKENAVTSPSNLIQKSTSGESFVFTVKEEGGKTLVSRVVVTPSKSYQGQTLIETGLNPGDLLIYKGYNEVVDKEEVNLLQVIEQTAAPAAATAAAPATK